MELYEFSDYRVFIKTVLLEKKKQFGKPFTFQELANSCRVSKTYMSKVLSGDGHLNEDQLYLASDFLKMKKREKDFIEILQRYQRSVCLKRKQEINLEIEKIKCEGLKTETHLSTPSSNLDSLMIEYFLDRHCILIHMFLTISRFNKNLNLICSILGIDIEGLLERIKVLEELGLIFAEKTGYRIIKDSLHLSKDSSIFEAFRDVQRLRTLERLRYKKSDPYSFSLTFTADLKAKEKIQKNFLSFLSEAEKIVNASDAEKVYQMNFDLVGWS